MPTALLLTLLSFFASAAEIPFEWSEALLSLPDASRNTPYSAKLPTSKLESGEKKSAEYSLVPRSGPRWLKVSPKGELSGVPRTEDRGEQSWKLRAVSGKRKAETVLRITVKNRVPQWKSSASKPFPIEEEQVVTRALSSEVEDADGDKLSFSKTQGPGWLSVTREGVLNLRPVKGDVGDWSAEIAAQDSESASTLTLKGTVAEKNHPPRLRKPIALEVKERETFSDTLTEYFVDENRNDSLRYRGLKPLPWLSLSPEGIVTARPGFSEVGTHSVPIEVSDGKATTKAALAIEVKRNARPPVWAEPAPRWTVQTRELFKTKVSSLAKDLDGLPLSFSKRSGPAWIVVSPHGEVSGTPDDSDEEDTKVVIRAQNDLASAEQEIFLRVIKKNYPPTLLKPFIFKVKERMVSEVELGRIGVIADKDNEPLVFSASASFPWLALTPKGEVRLSPSFKDIGTHRFVITVKDRSESVDLPATITVERNPRPPQWKELPLVTAKTREPVKLSLSEYVSDLDSLPVRFSKMEGPPWVQLTDKGQLSGTPTDADRGRSRVTVRAANDLAHADSVVTLELSKKNYPPVAAKPLIILVKEREEVAVDLLGSGAVTDLDREDLQFTFDKKPEWIRLEESRTLHLAPQFAHIGDHFFSLRSSDKEASTEFSVVIKVQRNPRPPEWKEIEPLTFQTREKAKAELATFAKDLDGLPLIFKKVQGPPWIAISFSGLLTGTPEDKDKGRFTIEVLASNDRASRSQRFAVEIQKKNYPLKVVKPLELTIKERESFRISLQESKTVLDPDADPLVFQSNSLPAWGTLSAGGKLELTPLYTHLGDHSFEINVKDSEAEVSLPVKLKVERNPRPPVWTAERLELKVKAREILEVPLDPLAKDLDGIRIQFSKAEGPSWASVDAKGTLKLAPQDQDMGRAELTLVAQHDSSVSSKKARIDVLFKNHPPHWKIPEIQYGSVRAGEKFGTKVSSFAADADAGDRLVFSKVRGPAWAMVAPNGIVFGKPPLSERGSHLITVLAADPSRESAEISGRVQIDAPTPRPSARVTTLKLPPAYQNELFTFNLGSIMNDRQFKYTKASGPDWLIIRPSGEAEGVPSMVGEFEFSVVVTNGRETLTVPGKGKVVVP